MSDGPIIVKPNPWPEIAGIAMRQVGMVGGGVVALFGFVSSHDLAGLFSYIRSEDGFAFFGATVAAVIAGWGYARAWLARHKMVTLAAAAPDDAGIALGAAWEFTPFRHLREWRGRRRDQRARELAEREWVTRSAAAALAAATPPPAPEPIAAPPAAPTEIAP